MRIVMTGATAGFGLFAASKLADAGHDLLVGARNPEAPPVELAGRAEFLPLDLDSLANVRAFAASVGEGAIDRLVLNAGLQLSKSAKSEDGFERTFAVNHLAHFLLLHLLADRLAPGARVIITGSGTHDPAEKTPVTPPIHAKAENLAYPDRDPQRETRVRQAGFRAYSSSKLCNIMTAREGALRMPQATFLAFDPGYVPHTSLGRDNPKWIATLVSYILPLMMKKDRSSTIARSGQYMADLVLQPRFSELSGTYWAVRSPDLVQIEPSSLARDSVSSRKLWDDSMRLVDLA
jgi:NAD(P)-dependent dehydrogenase (short-subunit alcohol dehydrogenase family)